jgi:hypothetical protein
MLKLINDLYFFLGAVQFSAIELKVSPSPILVVGSPYDLLQKQNAWFLMSQALLL